MKRLRKTPYFPEAVKAGLKSLRESRRILLGAKKRVPLKALPASNARVAQYPDFLSSLVALTNCFP